MSTFAVEATLIHPEHRERTVTTDFLVDTGAFHSLLPAEVVERLGLETQENVEGTLASGKTVVYKLEKCGSGSTVGSERRRSWPGRRDALRGWARSPSGRSRSPLIRATSGSSPPAPSGTSEWT